MDLSNYMKKEGRALPVFLLVDVSGSMRGEKIETVNVALKEMLNTFKKIENPKGVIELSIIAFGNGKAQVVKPLSKIEEKITMLARNLPCCLGMRDAEERVRSEMEKIVPVEIGYTEEGWFGIKMFALLPRKEHGNVNYIRQCLYYAMGKFFNGKILNFQKDCVLIYSQTDF